MNLAHLNSLFKVSVDDWANVEFSNPSYSTYVLLGINQGHVEAKEGQLPLLLLGMLRGLDDIWEYVIFLELKRLRCSM